MVHSLVTSSPPSYVRPGCFIRLFGLELCWFIQQNIPSYVKIDPCVFLSLFSFVLCSFPLFLFYSILPSGITRYLVLKHLKPNIISGKQMYILSLRSMGTPPLINPMKYSRVIFPPTSSMDMFLSISFVHLLTVYITKGGWGDLWDLLYNIKWPHI